MTAIVSAAIRRATDPIRRLCVMWSTERTTPNSGPDTHHDGDQHRRVRHDGTALVAERTRRAQGEQHA